MKKGSLDKLNSLKGPNSIETAPLISAVKENAPPDRCMSTYLIFFLHGIGHLLPWNFFITAHLVMLCLIYHAYDSYRVALFINQHLL